MAQTINTNLVSLNAQRNLSMSQSSLSTSMQRLSSGLRVNSAKDDAAGLAIAERMNTQVRGMNVAMRNANDGISMAQVGEGALGKVGDMLQRMRELAVQAANGTNTSVDRGSLNNEYLQLANEALRTLNGTEFNGQKILSLDGDYTFQIGANSNSELDQITITSVAWNNDTSISDAIGTDFSTPPGGLADDTGDLAIDAMNFLDTAIDAVNARRAEFGAVQNRFDNVISNLMVASENQTAARSRIMDADYAAETSNLSRAQILQQAGNAMVAQANQLPQQVLSLLQR